MTSTGETGFNLVRDPWIPIGSDLVSIREALAEAHQLPGWPGGDFGLAETVIRLLVPMVYRITGLDDAAIGDAEFAERQQVCFEQGRLREDAIDNYLDQYVDRFWLFDGPSELTPFAQDPSLSDVPPHEASKAVTAWASGNNPVLGPHTDTAELSPDLAAQRLLVLRAYAWGGLHTKHPDWKGQGKFLGGPLRGTMSVHPVGSTLAATLLSHLVPLPGGDTEFGSPFWEQPPLPNPVVPHTKRAGLLEQIAGRQDKTMLLRTSDGKITGFTLAEGPGVDRRLFCDDPYVLLDSDHEPQKPKANKAFWRESEGLIRDERNKPGRRVVQARILDWAAGENSDLYISERFSWAVVSHLGDRSKDLQWARNVTPHLLRLFDRAAGQKAQDFLSAADQAEERMVKQIAKVWHATGQMPGKAADKAAVYLPARAEFWRLAEYDFWEAVTARDGLSQENRTGRLRTHALAGFDRATGHLTRDQRALMAIVESRRWIEGWERPRSVRSENQTSDEKETAT